MAGSYGFWQDGLGAPDTLSASPAAPVNGPFGIPGKWHLVLDNEFNGTSLDASIWRTGWFGTGVTRPVNPGMEQDCYSPDNVTFPGDGTVHLNVTAKPSVCDGRTYPYTGALISTNRRDGRTSGGFQFTYGVVEERVYLPSFRGTEIANWPAIWADGQNWPSDGENDIIEGLVGSACFHFHYSASGTPAESGSCLTGNFSGWHTFAANWEKGSVTYYYDGKEVGRITSVVTAAPMYLIIDNTVAFVGKQLAKPGDLQVDYVRVWQRP